MNCINVVRLLHDVFVYSDIHVVVNNLEKHGVHAVSSEGHPEFYVDDETRRYCEEFDLNDKSLGTYFTRNTNSCQPRDKELPTLRKKILVINLSNTIIKNNQK